MWGAVAVVCWENGELPKNKLEKLWPMDESCSVKYNPYYYGIMVKLVFTIR